MSNRKTRSIAKRNNNQSTKQNNIGENVKQFTADEVYNLIRRDAVNKEKWFELNESTTLRVQPNLKLYLQALEASLDKRFQNRNLLYDFYLNTLIADDVVYSLIDKRLDNVTNKSLQLVDDDNNILEDYKYFLEAPKFRNFLKDLVMSKFWGFQLFGFKQHLYDNKLWFDYVCVNHKHVNPYNFSITKSQYDATEIFNYKNNPEFLFVGNADDLGLFSKITKLSISLRHNDFLYGKYADLASENFTQIQKRGLVDEKTLQEITKKMMNRGSGGVFESDNNLDLKFHNQSSSQQNALFKEREQSIRERLSILILGQTMTTMDGSSRAQAQVHESEQDDKYSSDEQFVLDVLNYEFIDYMKIWFPEFNVSGKRFKFIPKNTDEIRKKLNYYEKLKNLGVVFSDEELRNKFKEII